MAMRFVGSEKSEGGGRSDIFSVDPTLISMDESKNGRMFPVSDDAVQAMVESIERSGQLQPITCRRLKDKSIEIVSGFTRLKAFRLLYAKDPQYRINVKVVELSDFDSLMANIEENRQRNATTPLDDAFNMRRMERDFKRSRADIAAFYSCTEANVSRLVSLLALPDQVQRKIASQELTVDAASKLGKLTEPEIKSALEAAVAASDNGHVDTAEVTKQVRARGVKVGRTISDLRRVLKDRNEDIAVAILAYLKGEIDDEALEAALDGSHQYQSTEV